MVVREVVLVGFRGCDSSSGGSLVEVVVCLKS